MNSTTRVVHDLHAGLHQALGRRLNVCESAPADNQRKMDDPQYQGNHVRGKGSHSDNHGGTILADILRWIWKDYRK